MQKFFGLSLLFVVLIMGCQSKSAVPMIPAILATIPLKPGHPVETAINPQTGYAYITNKGAHINVLTIDTLEQVAAIQTGEYRTGVIAVDEDRGWVYVVNEYSESVSVLQGLEVKAILEMVGDAPTDIALNPENGWAYVVTGYKKNPPPGEKRTVEGNVTVISGTEVIGTIPLGRVLAMTVTVDPINNLVYVGGVGGEVIVIHEMEEVARLDIGSRVQAIDTNPTTGDVYALNALGPEYLYHFKNGEIVDAIDVERDGGSVTNMKVHPVTGDVYVVDFIAREVVVVRSIEGKLSIIGRPSVGSGPEKMTIDPVTGNVYVANFYEDTVSVIHGTETIATIDVGYYPYGIGVNSANGWVYVSNTNDNSITILGFEE